MYKPQRLPTFQAVHRTRSFAIAARELDYTASAVSQQIAALEESTGLVLFEREARDRDRGRAPLRRTDQPIACQCRRSRLRGSPARPRLDAGLVYEYGLCPRRWPEDISRKPLLREDLLLLRPAEHDEPVRLADALWITSRADTAGAQSLSRLCAAAGFSPTIAFRSNNYDVVRELVVATGAVAVVPALAQVPDERVKAVPPTQESAHRTVFVAHRTGSSNLMLDEFLTSAHRSLPSGTDHLTPLS
ncbi:hypothetical protein GCM10022222_38840 [Amycolatopsis ultiminotia]|uniref:HTH lysR-type domain-containing protein n=1 Tax=Amycolatopsis ultiminotia TaxID=543629 RepID=A0ABP6WKR2_9PSEU